TCSTTGPAATCAVPVDSPSARVTSDRARSVVPPGSAAARMRVTSPCLMMVMMRSFWSRGSGYALHTPEVPLVLGHPVRPGHGRARRPGLGRDRDEVAPVAPAGQRARAGHRAQALRPGGVERWEVRADRLG